MTADAPEHAVYSVSRIIASERPVAASRVTAAVSGWVEDLGSWARERGYLVGHIKGLLECEDDRASISGTGGAPTVKTYGQWDRLEVTTVGLSATAIILGPAERELCNEATERLDSALGALRID